MAGIYIHIPFCRKACHYCNFHFSTSLKLKNDMLASILWEIEEKAKRNEHTEIGSVYFGGGTPSLMEATDIELLLHTIRNTYSLNAHAEITLEANPDDMQVEKVRAWRAAGINRLSIGIQSFREEDLLQMNRSHGAMQAINCIPLAQREGFDNITLDLIFGYPELSDVAWKQNIDIALQLQVPHISCYAMTVEPKTALDYHIRSGKRLPLNQEHAAKQYEYLMQRLEEAGFEHYEISSYAKPGYRAVHNSNYWNGIPYLGMGPSAHTYDGNTRSWNVANNAHYIKQCEVRNLTPEVEVLQRTQRINEWIMVRLRITDGLYLDTLFSSMNEQEQEQFNRIKHQFIQQGLLSEENHILRLTQAGKLFADHVASELFVEDIS